MSQDGKSNPASPPFASPSGKPASAGGGSGNGAHDFVKEPSSGAKGGGRDFTKESRSQSEADPRGAGEPNSAEVPAGGKILLADPGPVSKTVSGSAPGVSGGKVPFKGLR